MLSCRNTSLYGSAIIGLVFFRMVRAGAYWHKIHDIHACAFAVQKNIVRYLVWISRGLLRRHCETFNINAEKPKFYSGTVVYFTLADLLETNCLSPCYGPED